MSDFRITLKGARVNAGFGSSEAARLLGIGRTTLWQYENGVREPKRELVERMCDLYHCPIEFLAY